MVKIMNKYVENTINSVKEKHKDEPEFVQTVEEVFSSISQVIDAHPEYEKVDLLVKMVEPENLVLFDVNWEDDKGIKHTNKGYRVQFNSVLGPYKGGLRFQKNVTLNILKFLGFEQTFKNSLTGYTIGGGKGGSDFDPAGKSEAEIKRFCEAFMQGLYKYIGSTKDVPAGDMGVGGREIKFLFDEYIKLTGSKELGFITGKDISFGGSILRPEATGYGAIYYLNEVLKHENDTIKGKRIGVSGYGNVAWGIMKKAAELGAKVTYMAGPDGYIHDEDGIITEEKLNFILDMRQKDPMHCKPYADKFGCEFVPNKKFWGVKDVDVYMPAATQNDVDIESAKKIIDSKVKYYLEVANMPTINEALNLLRKSNIIVAPSKAVNAGGVGVSFLEMEQNRKHETWTKEQVDEELKRMMIHIYNASVDASKRYNLDYDLVSGANIAGFERVAEAMYKKIKG